ncbi:hypothetical protein DXG01_006256 [Tephrocybe rancida]|nr:hypothetical protein DXG01_006256 [Tephrocybe rancida]
MDIPKFLEITLHLATSLKDSANKKLLLAVHSPGSRSRSWHIKTLIGGKVKTMSAKDVVLVEDELSNILAKNEEDVQDCHDVVSDTEINMDVEAEDIDLLNWEEVAEEESGRFVDDLINISGEDNVFPAVDIIDSGSSDIFSIYDTPTSKQADLPSSFLEQLRGLWFTNQDIIQDLPRSLLNLPEPVPFQSSAEPIILPQLKLSAPSRSALPNLPEQAVTPRPSPEPTTPTCTPPLVAPNGIEERYPSTEPVFVTPLHLLHAALTDPKRGRQEPVPATLIRASATSTDAGPSTSSPAFYIDLPHLTSPIKATYVGASDIRLRPTRVHRRRRGTLVNDVEEDLRMDIEEVHETDDMDIDSPASDDEWGEDLSSPLPKRQFFLRSSKRTLPSSAMVVDDEVEVQTGNSGSDEDNSEGEVEKLQFQSPFKKSRRALRKRAPSPDNSEVSEVLGQQDDVEAEPELISTNILDTLNYAYNVKAGILICTLCNTGIPFRQAISHAVSARTYNRAWEGDAYSVHASSISRHRCSPITETGTSRVIPRKDYPDLIKKELQEKLDLESPPKLMDCNGSMTKSVIEAWHNEAVQIFESATEPLAGITVYTEGIKCLVGTCIERPYCSLSEGAIRKHHSEQHGSHQERKVQRHVCIQTLTNTQSFLSYVEVPRPCQPSDLILPLLSSMSVPPNIPTPVIEAERALWAAQENIPGGVMPETIHKVDLVNPAYIATRLPEFWETIDKSLILDILGSPTFRSGRIKNNDDRQKGFILAEACALTFFRIASHVKQASPWLQKLIVKGSYSSKRDHRFLVPNPQTLLQGYFPAELQLLQRVLELFRRKVRRTDGRLILDVDDDQEDALKTLDQSLNQGDGVEIIAKHITTVFHCLYFPKSGDCFFFDKYANPITAVLALSFLSPDGTPRTIGEIPPICAKIQFSIRLRGYHHLHTVNSQSKSAGGSTRSTSPANVAHSTPGNNAPSSADAQDTMDVDPILEPGGSNSMSSGPDLASGPGVGFARFVGGQEDKDLPLQENIAKHKFLEDFISYAIKFCARFLSQDEAGSYGDNRDFLRLFYAQYRCLRNPAIVRWLSNGNTVLIGSVETTVRDSILFGHTLESLGLDCDFEFLKDSGDITTPGHSIILPAINKLNDESRKLYDAFTADKKLFTIVNSTLKWKQKAARNWEAAIFWAFCELYAIAHITQVLTGRFKEILRIYPYPVARLLYILLRLVRPLEVLYTSTCHFGGSKKVGNIYATSLWAGMGAPMGQQLLRDQIPALFEQEGEDGKTLPFKLNFRQYRHLATAIQRKHLPDHPPKYTEAVEKQRASTGDEQAGRSTNVSRAIYAVEQIGVPGDPFAVEHYINFSMAWHRFWDLETKRMAGKKYTV